MAELQEPMLQLADEAATVAGCQQEQAPQLPGPEQCGEWRRRKRRRLLLRSPPAASAAATAIGE